jgi:hypothetical protein
MLSSRIRIPLALALAASALALTAAGASAFTFNAHWGGVGVIAHSHQNLCRMEGMEPGDHREVLVHSNHNRDAVTMDGLLFKGTLMCSSSGYILPSTIGPGEGHSLRCPSGQIPVNGGAGFHSSRGDALTQAHGGFGSGHDGYWHYKWLNHLVGVLHVQMWAVCLTNTAVMPRA